MGKIRVKTLGDDALEQEQKQKRQQEREEKKALAKSKDKSRGKQQVADAPEGSVTVDQMMEAGPSEQSKKEGKKFRKKRAEKKLSPRHRGNLEATKKGTSYPLVKAIEVLKQFKKAKFDETVELHINLKESGVYGNVSLPHGTGKQIRVKVADEELIEQVAKGKVDFDVLVARPEMMVKLAKVARILGPKGLMPNPKNGTISNTPDVLIEKLSKGQVSYKSEAKFPILHMAVGKTSFSEKQIEENVKALLKSVGAAKINDITLKSTMSPAIRVSL